MLPIRTDVARIAESSLAIAIAITGPIFSLLAGYSTLGNVLVCSYHRTMRYAETVLGLDDLDLFCQRNVVEYGHTRHGDSISSRRYISSIEFFIRNYC